MTFTEKQLGQTQLGLTQTTLYQVPAATIGVLKSLHACMNTVSSSVHFDAYMVPSGGTAGDATAMFRRFPIHDVVHWAGWMPFKDAGSTLQVRTESAVNVVTIVAGGAEIA